MITSTPQQRALMAGFIYDCEVRLGLDKKPKVYPLPEADGGGSFEVAGINDRYHPEMARHLARLIHAESYDRVRVDAVDYLIKYTEVVTLWSETPAVEAYLRDCAFNRGPKGALRILQIAIHAADDGKWGPRTRAALAEASRDLPGLLKRLRAAREAYEKRVAPPTGKRAKFWKGLVNRWDKALTFAEGLL